VKTETSTPISSGPSTPHKDASRSQQIHTWKTVSCTDRQLVDAFSSLELTHPVIKEHLNALQRGNIGIRLASKHPDIFRHEVEELLNQSPKAVKFFISNDKQRAGTYVKDGDSHPSAPATSSSSRKFLDVVCTSLPGGALPGNEIAAAIAHIAQYEKKREWPPVFAVLARDKPPVSENDLQSLAKISTEDLKRRGDLLRDLSNSGFAPHHGESAGKLVAPIMTVKVAQGDTLMVQYALENELKPGDVVFIDGKFERDPNTAAYANVGGLLREIAIAGGAKGFIVDGFIRDSDEYNKGESGATFHCYAKGVTPNGPTKLDSGAINLPVYCGNHSISSNDICIAEGKNLFIIPAENVSTIVKNVAAGGASNPSGSDVAAHERKMQQGPRQRVLNQIEQRHRNVPPAPPPRKNVTDEVLHMAGEVPAAEYADSYSTVFADADRKLRAPITTGIPIQPARGANLTESAGMALVTEGTQESVEKAILTATPKDTLVIHTDNSSEITFNEFLLHAAEEKSIAAVVTNGTAALESDPRIPVYAAHYVDQTEPLREGQGKMHEAVEMYGVKINPGDVIVGDKDGFVAIPEGREEYGMRGGHAIKAKEDETLVSIRNGTAAKRTLPHALFPSSDPANALFLRSYIDHRNAPIHDARGSSGLDIRPSRTVLTATVRKLKKHLDVPALATLLADKGKGLAEGKTVKGTLIDVVFDGGKPPIYTLEQPSKLPFRKPKLNVVSELPETQFLHMMKAKDEGTKIKINKDGTITPSAREKSK
jgi:regulator of RNase E activity RraA